MASWWIRWLHQTATGTAGTRLKPPVAEDERRHAIQLNPNDAGAFIARGVAYGVRGAAACRLPPCPLAIEQYDRAIGDFDQAIRLNPNDAVAFVRRGINYGAKGQPDRAIEDFDQAIRLNPNDATAFVNRGNAYFSKGLNIARENGMCLAAYRPASCALAIAQYDRSIADFDQAIRLNPNDAIAAWAYGARGGAKSSKGDFAGADADLATARQLSSSVGK